MSEDTLQPQLWKPRSVDETLDVYKDWADTYDDDVTGKGYVTPFRIADALSGLIEPGHAILDFGCGTGISGAALTAKGLGPVDGTDISEPMVDKARAKGIYRSLWVSEPGETPATPGDYEVIVAAGVISLGAAPPETLDQLLASSAAGGFILLSFNDPTIEHGSYDAYLETVIADGKADLISRDHGPHLTDIEMGSDVIVLRRT